MKKEKKDFLVDFSTTKLTKQSHFEAFEQNKEVACMLWHINSAFHRFSQLEDLQGVGGPDLDVVPLVAIRGGLGADVVSSIR
jgi:hypothetical protein